MNQSIRQKNTKILSLLDIIELLNLLKSEEIPAIAEHFEITVSAVYYQQRKYQAYDDDRIDRKVRDLEKKIVAKDYDYPPRDYQRQEACDHHQCTLFLKCSCTLTLSENDIDQAIEILLRKKEYLKNNKRVDITI